MGVNNLVFELWAAKAEKKGVFAGFVIAMVTYYINVINKTYLAITHLSNDTILLPFIVTECFNTSIKRQGF